MLIEQSDFGITRSGGHAHLFSIQNGSGMRAVLTDYGAILVSLFVPGPDGITRDVVLGYDTLPEYEAGGFFGATVGRHANRISGAAFMEQWQLQQFQPVTKAAETTEERLKSRIR